MSEPEITGWKFTSGIHAIHGWDVMQVVAVNENAATGQRRPVTSFTLARDAEGKILRKTDIFEERWEIVTDPGDLKDFGEFFAMRDRAQAEKIMETPHKQVVTSYPIAIKSGQRRIHVREERPFHAFVRPVKCPDCSTVFIADRELSDQDVLDALAKHHHAKVDHPDYIASQPVWTQIEDCECGR
jgi:hypothetical protein